jgi:hypothetical protein
MSKKGEVGEDFSEHFSSVGFYVQIDYGRDRNLGHVTWAAEKHNGVHFPRISHEKSGVKVVNIIFARLYQETASLAQNMKLAMNHGLRPAVYPEIVAFLDQATPEEIACLFKYADSIHVGRRITCPVVAAIPCLGTAVTGQSGELIPVQMISRFTPNPRTQLQLLKLAFGSRVPPAQLVPFVR